MSERGKLLNLVMAVSSAKKTGKVYTYTHGADHVLVGILFFDEGRLCGCSYDKEIGRQALNDFVRSEVTTTTFLEADAIDRSVRSEMPDVELVIALLEKPPVRDVAPKASARVDASLQAHVS